MRQKVWAREERAALRHRKKIGRTAWADKVLKKQPNFQCCKVLKCLALIRLGKELDAEIILNKVLITVSKKFHF